MMTVAQILDDKTHKSLLTVAPDQTVQHALEIMATHRVSSLPVLRGTQLVGIISERDYIRKAVPRLIAPWDLHVRDIMTEKVIHVSRDDTVQECMRLMTTHGIRHLPVVAGETLVDIVSITDVLRIRAMVGDF
ncbi:MAG: CBS domain-containing protein [Gammaproteobacteria bacterium]